MRHQSYQNNQQWSVQYSKWFPDLTLSQLYLNPGLEFNGYVLVKVKSNNINSVKSELKF